MLSCCKNIKPGDSVVSSLGNTYRTVSGMIPTGNDYCPYLVNIEVPEYSGIRYSFLWISNIKKIIKYTK